MAGPSIGDLLAQAKQAPPEHRDVPVVLDRAVAGRLEAIADKIGQRQAEHDEQADAFQEELADLERDKRAADPRPAELEERAAATLSAIQEQIDALTGEQQRILAEAAITLRFTKLPGPAWSAITAPILPRPNVGIDSFYGYDYHEAARQAAPYVDERTQERYGARVIAATGDDGSETLETLEAGQWAELFELLSGGEFERIAIAIFELNDYAPRQRAAASKKA